jgi:hypothetical protein
MYQISIMNYNYRIKIKSESPDKSRVVGKLI